MTCVRTLRHALLALSLVAIACGDDDSGMMVADVGPGADAGTDTGETMDAGNDAGPPMACEPTMAACEDEQIIELGLFEEPTDGVVTNEDTGAHWRTHVDATGGGFMTSEAFLYARFTDTGLEKVDLDDVSAFESADWDIAFRRFVIRLNSGVSGPSCVTAARTAPATEFDTLAELPEGLSFRTEAYYTDPDCEIVPDGSGLGSPGVALASYWNYASCVQMTGNVYVLELADGRHVKLQVLSYYSEDVQAACNETGSLPDGPSGSGNVNIVWAFL